MRQELNPIPSPCSSPVFCWGTWRGRR